MYLGLWSNRFQSLRLMEMQNCRAWKKLGDNWVRDGSRVACYGLLSRIPRPWVTSLMIQSSVFSLTMETASLSSSECSDGSPAVTTHHSVESKMKSIRPSFFNPTLLQSPKIEQIPHHHNIAPQWERISLRMLSGGPVCSRRHQYSELISGTQLEKYPGR